MPKGTNQKFKLYRLAQIMMKKTDEEHYITMPEIKAALAEYDITADRKSLYNDLRDLEILGIEVEGEQDEYFICDLIGLKVVTDEGEDFGVLTDVIQTGANDVYAVKCPNGKEVLLPVIDECILDVDLERQQVTAHIMPGLVD